MAMESESLSLVCIIYCNETAGCCGALQAFVVEKWGGEYGKGTRAKGFKLRKCNKFPSVHIIDQ